MIRRRAVTRENECSGTRRRWETQDWIVRQVLIPLHSKIRVSFNDLRKMTLEWLIPEIQKVVAGESDIKDSTKLPTVRFRHWIERGHRFVRRVLTEKLLSEKGSLFIRTDFMMPRYVAVIRLVSERFGQIDILVDTTSPRPNFVWLAVLSQSADNDKGKLRHLICDISPNNVGAITLRNPGTS